MEIKLTNAFSYYGKKHLIIMMRTFVFLFCSTVFSFTSSNVLSQNSKIQIDVDQELTIDEIFSLITDQTKYAFVYRADLFKNSPKIHLKKGIVKTQALLKRALSNSDVKYVLTNKNTIQLYKSSLNNRNALQQTITGKVTDKSGLPIPGVSVYIKGTTTGVVTDFDGKYKITVPFPENVLIFSSLGFVKQEVTVGSSSTLNIIMDEDISQLEEVLLIGYGTANKNKTGSAVIQVKAEEIEKISAGATSIEQILGGQLAGVQITQNGGTPGAPADIRIRGFTSPFTGGKNQPLYVIDGVAVLTDAQFDLGFSLDEEVEAFNPLQSINPDNIESLTVLKDAAATAIYGSRGANGVILIKTKRGRKNNEISTAISYNFSMSNLSKKLDYMDTSNLKEFYQTVALNTLDAYNMGTANLTSYNIASTIIDPNTGELREATENPFTGETLPLFYNANNDWQDLIYEKNAPSNQWNVGVSGGTDKLNFMLNLSHTNQTPLLIKSSYKKYGVNLAADFDSNSWLKIGTTLNYNATTDKNPQFGTFAVRLLSNRPDVPIYDENGKFVAVPQLSYRGDGFATTSFFSNQNPLAQLEKEFEGKQNSFIGSVYAEASLFKDLKIRVETSVGLFQTNNRLFSPSVSVYSISPWSTPNDELTLARNETLNRNLGLNINYHKIINKHNLGVLFGLSYDRFSLYQNQFSFQGFPDPDVFANAGSANGVTGHEEGEAVSGLSSLFSRLQYAYDNKYSVTLNFRTDKSSKFGPNNRRGYFPSFAFNWDVTNEDFLKDIESINKLNIRSSYGKSGSANLPDFSYQQLYQTPNYGNYNGENTIVPVFSNFPDVDVRWETTLESNLGLDFSLFNNRLYGNLDYYNKITDDALVAKPFPLESGATSATSNYAKLSNKGLEVLIGGDIIRTKDFRWSANFNIAFNKNKVEKIKGLPISNLTSTYFQEGEPLGVIRGYIVEHIIQDQAEMDALNNGSPTGFYQESNRGPGDYKYKDINGDGRITSADGQEIIGNIQPDYFGGMNTNLSYKNWSLNAAFNYSVGADAAASVYSLGRSVPSSGIGSLLNQSYDDYWRPDNSNASEPRKIFGGVSTGYRSTANLYKTSYLKLKSLRLNYKVSKEMINKLPIKTAQLYIVGTNLFTITNFPAEDPESLGTGSRSLYTNSNNGVYPYATSFIFGVKIGL